METATDTVGATAPVHIPRETTAIAKRDPYASLAQFASHLENLQIISERLCKSTLLPKAMQSPANLQLVLAQGLEMGFTVMQAIRASFIIESKDQPAKVGYYVEGLVALVRQSGVCRFFRVEIMTADKCRVVCARKDEAEDIIHVFELTMAEARAANLDKKWEWDAHENKRVAKTKYPWVTAPSDMLRARTCGRAVKAVFQDVVFGMATPDELDAIEDANIIEMMESGPGKFEPIPMNTNTATRPSSAPASFDPDLPPAEYSTRTAPNSVPAVTPSGDAGWDAALLALSKLEGMEGTVFDGWLPEDINEHWDGVLAKCEMRASVNAFASWIAVFSKYAEKSKTCGGVAQRMKVTFNARMDELKKAERAAVGGAA